MELAIYGPAAYPRQWLRATVTPLRRHNLCFSGVGRELSHSLDTAEIKREGLCQQCVTRAPFCLPRPIRSGRSDARLRGALSGYRHRVKNSPFTCISACVFKQ